MKKYIPAIIVSVTMLLLVGGVITYAVVSADKNTPKAAFAAVNISADNANTDPTTQALTQNGTSLGVSTDATGNSLQSNLGGQSSSSGSGSSSAAVPGPDQFGQYDQYKDKEAAMFADIVTGTGTEVTNNTKVAVTYQGWLTNGTLFDQSKTNDKGQLEALTFVVGAHNVIPGWEQAIIGMKVGGKRRFIVPPSVGYGAQGQGPIPPNALLVFDVNLLQAL